jgi:hypothetical protein
VAKTPRRAQRPAATTETVATPTPTWLKPWMVLVLALVILAPFVTRAMTIDDPLFVWTAQHLQQHPTDPFGFETNWFGVPQSMLINVQNPPLTSYWLALAGLVSWDDVWLHVSLLPFALLAVWGVIRLAGLLGADPFWAALLTVGSVAFLISATNVMCDVMLVALMVWAIVLWVEGLNRSNVWILLAAAVVAALAAFSKYFGISLIPLLAAYTLIRQKRVTWALAPLAVTVALLAGWHFWTVSLYGVSHVLGAAKYAKEFGNQHLDGARYYAAVTFLGGCIVWPLVIGLWRARLEWIGYAVAAGLGAAILHSLRSGPNMTPVPGSSIALAGVFFAAGVAVFALTAAYQWKNRRRPEAWLLGLWIWGTIVFLAIVNWTVAARNLLPMIPALAILVAMRPARDEASGGRKYSAAQEQKPLPLAPFAVASALGLAVGVVAMWADADWAGGVRRTAGELAAKYQAEGKQVYFQGHWGFQYYMERAGAKAQDFRNPVPGASTIVVVPANNTNIEPRAIPGWQLLDVRKETAGGGLYVNDPVSSAGFYCHIMGLLPLALAVETPDQYYILQPPREWFQPPDGGQAAPLR